MHDIAHARRVSRDFDERLAGVGITPRGQYVTGKGLTQRNGDRGENPARDREQMRGEHQISGTVPLLYERSHLLEMSMYVRGAVRESVCAEVAIDLTEQQLTLWRVTSSRHAARRVDDDRGIVRDEVALDERRKSRQDGRWITPWIADEGRMEYLLTRELGEPVGNPFAAVAGAQVRREVDHPRPLLSSGSHPGFRRAVWQGAENEGRIADRRVLGGGERHLMSAETGRRPPLIIGGSEREFELWMMENEGTELAARIAARAEHSYRYSIHPECIIMRTRGVNSAPTSSYRALTAYAILPAVEREPGMKKRDRHDAILSLIERRPIASQEELRQALAEQGWHVTQATLSRDLRELGIVRAPTSEGARYMRPQMLGGDDGKPSLEALLPQLFDDIDGVSELLVLHTLPGGAQPIAEAIDAQGWTEIIGTIGGENTILIVCRSEQARLTLSERLRIMAVRRPAART